MLELKLLIELNKKQMRILEEFIKKLEKYGFEYLEIKEGYESIAIPLYCENGRFHLLYYEPNGIQKLPIDIECKRNNRISGAIIKLSSKADLVHELIHVLNYARNSKENHLIVYLKEYILRPYYFFKFSSR